MGRMAIAKEETHSVAIHQAIVVVSVFFFFAKEVVCVTAFVTVSLNELQKVSIQQKEERERERERQI